MRTGDVIVGAVLGAGILLACVVAHERGLENESIREYIKSEIRIEMDRRYRNVPRIEIGRAYTVVATGDEIAIDEVGDGE